MGSTTQRLGDDPAEPSTQNAIVGPQLGQAVPQPHCHSQVASGVVRSGHQYLPDPTPVDVYSSTLDPII